MSKDVIYLSGTVSSRPYAEAVEAFAKAEAEMEARGWCLVINPTKLCEAHWSWLRCMAVCLFCLIPCDAIYMMKGWEKSRGARIERQMAKIMFKRVLYEWSETA